MGSTQWASHDKEWDMVEISIQTGCVNKHMDLVSAGPDSKFVF